MLVRSAMKCSSTAGTAQLIKIKGLKSGGSVKITGLSQEASISVDFSCKSASNMRADMATNLINEMKNLDCELYIDKKYNIELIDTIKKLKNKEKI